MKDKKIHNLRLCEEYGLRSRPTGKLWFVQQQSSIMKSKFLLFAFVIFLLVASCAAADVPSQGVRGSVLLGPHCPVVQEGEECPDTPFQTELVVTGADGMDEIKEFSSDASGMFSVLLPIGEYAIRSPLGATMPYCTSEVFAVAASQMTEITVYCDTGIR